MRKLMVLLVICIALGCKTENEASTADEASLESLRKGAADFSSKHAEYRAFPIHVKFIEPSEAGQHPGDVMRSKRAFIKASGLPDESNIHGWKQKHNPKEALGIYQRYIKKNAGHSSLPTFRQYGSWLVLTRLDLLNEKDHDAAGQVAFYLQELVDTKYEGYELLHYTLNYLHQQGYKTSVIKSAGEKILQYGNEPAAPVKQAPAGIQASQEVPEKIRESVDRYVSQKESAKAAALQRISSLLAQL